ncbi:glycosyltransferase family 2 protein [Pseudoxanthomonas sp. SGT-18]|jgi:Glycosyltransferases involved in cell wall biogenesis|uniref:glycosyltransferase family 2 protein n=1 Tax=Pseudoxanthomonas sp. SGT-18 TaxID=2493087 RepID=UPI000F628DA7|nr:glycosyltransferase family 2 protein [Pseudoxanthomonas sp. SGT-18]
MRPTPELSVVIPVYGSASILPALAERLEAALAPALGADGYEVVLVHDCGPDNAWEVIQALASARPWLRGLDLRRNAGQHNAIMAGLGVARGRYIVTMDDDLQHDPADVPRILAALRGGADLVYAQFPERQHALWKRAGSRFNDLVAQWLLKKPRGLYLSPFRGFARGLRDEVLRYQGPFVYLDGLLLQSTSPRRIATLTAEHHARSDGRSGYSLRKSVSLWLQMATSFSIVPLRLVSLAGALASCLAFVLAVAILVQKLRTPDLPVGWASLIVAILFMGGLQLLALGAIGEYTGRVLLNVNKRPQYVVGDSVNLPPA